MTTLQGVEYKEFDKDISRNQMSPFSATSGLNYILTPSQATEEMDYLNYNLSMGVITL